MSTNTAVSKISSNVSLTMTSGKGNYKISSKVRDLLSDFSATANELPDCLRRCVVLYKKAVDTIEEELNIKQPEGAPPISKEVVNGLTQNLFSRSFDASTGFWNKLWEIAEGTTVPQLVFEDGHIRKRLKKCTLKMQERLLGKPVSVVIDTVLTNGQPDTKFKMARELTETELDRVLDEKGNIRSAKAQLGVLRQEQKKLADRDKAEKERREAANQRGAVEPEVLDEEVPEELTDVCGSDKGLHFFIGGKPCCIPWKVIKPKMRARGIK